MRGVSCTLLAGLDEQLFLTLSFRPGNRASAAAVPASPPKGHLFDFCGERWAPGPGSSSVQCVTPCRFSALCGVRRGCVATLHVRVTSACPPTGRICFVVSHSAMSILNPRSASEATGTRNLYVPSISGLSSTWKTARERLSRNSVAGQWYNTDFPGNAQGFSLLELHVSGFNSTSEKYHWEHRKLNKSADFRESEDCLVSLVEGCSSFASEYVQQTQVQLGFTRNLGRGKLFALRSMKMKPSVMIDRDWIDLRILRMRWRQYVFEASIIKVQGLEQ